MSKMYKSISSQAIRQKLKAFASLLAVALAVSACGTGTNGGGKNSNPTIPGVTGPTVTYLNGNFTMSVVIQNVAVSAGVTVPIPHMPNSSIEVGPDLQTNGLLLSTTLSSADLTGLANGSVALLNPTELPGGRPLPGVAAGNMPAIAVTVPKWDNMVFYVGPTIFGTFVPVNLGLQGYIATFNLYDPTGKDIGQISIVGEDSSKTNGGFLILIPFNTGSSALAVLK
jgi:hypothetical protein